MIQVSSFHTRILVSFSEPEILKKVCVTQIWSLVFDMPSLTCLQDILVKELSNQLGIRIRGLGQFVSTQ